MASWEAPHRIRVPAVQQSWRSLTFVHVGYPPEVIAGFLPHGLVPDTFDGMAWVGITPFRMHASLLPVAPGPRVPVGEVNVRTYVRDRRGEDALWFLSLELEQCAVVAGLRTTLRLPYRWARTDITVDEDHVGYLCARRRPHRPGGLSLEVEVGQELQPRDVGDFETFLVGRWRAYTTLAGRLVSVPVEHQPWTLHRAEASTYDEDLTSSLGLPEPATAPHLLFSPGVDARLGWPRPVA